MGRHSKSKSRSHHHKHKDKSKKSRSRSTGKDKNPPKQSKFSDKPTTTAVLPKQQLLAKPQPQPQNL